MKTILSILGILLASSNAFAIELICNVVLIDDARNFNAETGTNYQSYIGVHFGIDNSTNRTFLVTGSPFNIVARQVDSNLSITLENQDEVFLEQTTVEILPGTAPVISFRWSRDNTIAWGVCKVSQGGSKLSYVNLKEQLGAIDNKIQKATFKGQQAK